MFLYNLQDFWNSLHFYIPVIFRKKGRQETVTPEITLTMILRERVDLDVYISELCSRENFISMYFSLLQITNVN